VWSVFPSQSKLVLSNNQIRIALCRQLCIDSRTAPPDLQVCPRCASAVTTTNPLAWDDHIINCTRDGHHATSHNHVQTTIQNEAKLRSQPSTLAQVVKDEPNALITDLLFPLLPGRNGTTATTIDVSIINPMAKTNIARTAAEANQPLASARLREREKINKYQSACAAHNLDFRPVVFESTGALGQSAKDFFAVLLGSACALPDDTLTESDFNKIVKAVVTALHRSIGSKFETAAATFRDGRQPDENCP